MLFEQKMQIKQKAVYNKLFIAVLVFTLYRMVADGQYAYIKLVTQNLLEYLRRVSQNHIFRFTVYHIILRMQAQCIRDHTETL